MSEQFNVPVPPYAVSSAHVAATIDNRNHMVGWVTGDDGRPNAASWSSRTGKSAVLGFTPVDPTMPDLRPVLLALSDRSGLAAGIAAAWPFDLYYPPLDGHPQVAVVWSGEGDVVELPRLAPGQPSAAYAAQDDHRVGGWAFDATGLNRAVVWNCADGR